jgi:hypothetical protein
MALDPLYLSLLTGEAADGRQASNLYDTGPLLMAAGRVCLDAGATPFLAHHTGKPHARPSPEPLELPDLAFSGIGEYVRQWLLVNRREAFDPENGDSKLWLAGGGSCGQSGLWAVDVHEGRLADDFSGLVWEVNVRPASEARAANASARQDQRSRNRDEQVVTDGTTVLSVLARKDPDRRGAVYTHVRAAARLSNDRMLRAVDALIEEGHVERVPVAVHTGKHLKVEKILDGLRKPPQPTGGTDGTD